MHGWGGRKGFEYCRSRPLVCHTGGAFRPPVADVVPSQPPRRDTLLPNSVDEGYAISGLGRGPLIPILSTVQDREPRSRLGQVELRLDHSWFSFSRNRRLRTGRVLTSHDRTSSKLRYSVPLVSLSRSRLSRVRVCNMSFFLLLKLGNGSWHRSPRPDVRIGIPTQHYSNPRSWRQMESKALALYISQYHEPRNRHYGETAGEIGALKNPPRETRIQAQTSTRRNPSILRSTWRYRTMG